MYDRSRLITLFRDRALRFGDFKLASGRMAKYYLDGKQISLHSEGLRLVSEGLLDLLGAFAGDPRRQLTILNAVSASLCVGVAYLLARAITGTRWKLSVRYSADDVTRSRCSWRRSPGS